FTVWSSVVHAGIMAVQSMPAAHSGHLLGDVPALLLVAIVLGGLLVWSEQERAEHAASGPRGGGGGGAWNENRGHMGPVPHPDLVNEAIRRFLERTQRTRAAADGRRPVYSAAS